MSKTACRLDGVLVLGTLGFALACSGNPPANACNGSGSGTNPCVTTGGASAAAGATGVGGNSATGGSQETGGVANTGGAATAAQGGASSTAATGGAPTGGVSAAGGNPSTGGVRATGGMTGAGGAATGGGVATGGASSPGGNSGLTFSIDMQKGPTRQYSPPSAPARVSPYVYGINGFGTFVATKTKWGLIRQGGDGATAYNWTIDYGNSGADYCYYQGQADNGNIAGRYTDSAGDTVPTALAKGEAFLASIPILDFVAAKFDRNVGWSDSGAPSCPGTDSACPNRSGGYSANVVDLLTGDSGYGQALSFASSNPNSPAFVKNVMTKGSAFCSCAPGTKTCAGCATALALNPVAQDEFVNFLKVNYGTGGAPIFFDLDNEPNYWPGTHPELYPNDCGSGTVTWDDIVNRNVSAAKAVKAVWSTARVFGPVVAQDGIVYANDYASSHFTAGTFEFTDYYLQQLANQSDTAGMALLDVFDVHYYTDGSSDTLCLEAPRLFWDPNATDISATTANNIDFGYGDHSYWDKYWYPRQMIPRLQRKVATAYTGKSTPAPGISFSEYNAGCEMAISGGVAQADLLGIFGREGVFAATAWPLQCNDSGCGTNFLVAAFNLYRNYDGNGAVVGDLAVSASTSESKLTSVYGFANSSNPNVVDIVAINKNATAQSVTIRIANAPALTSVGLYRLAGTSAAVAAVTAAVPTISCSGGTCTLVYSMPALSATTLVLR